MSLSGCRNNDNNAAERALRRPVVTRKNAYGSRNDDAARLAARIWTVTATAEMAGLNPVTYLTAYLDACGRNGGQPLPGTTVRVCDVVPPLAAFALFDVCAIVRAVGDGASYVRWR